MHKERQNRHQTYDLYADFEKLKQVIADASHDMTGKASQLVNESLEGLKEKSNLMKDNLADYAAERPFKSIVTAFIVGTIVGYLLHKK